MSKALVGKNSNYFSAITLYANYAFQGIAVIILAQHMSSLTGHLGTDTAGVVFVSSFIGWGRLFTVSLAGYLSDKFGRKPMVLFGMLCYIIFFGGILISSNVYMGAAFAVFAGIGNSFLDTGTYPALAELFPKAAGIATVLLRSFITIGQFALPLVISFIISRDMFFGYTFMIMIGLVIANGIVILLRPLANQEAKDLAMQVQAEESSSEPKTKLFGKANFWLEGIGLVALGFTAVATFSITVTWLPLFAQEVSGMEELAALRLVSVYSSTAFIAIFVTAALVKKIKPVNILLALSFRKNTEWQKIIYKNKRKT